VISREIGDHWSLSGPMLRALLECPWDLRKVDHYEVLRRFSSGRGLPPAEGVLNARYRVRILRKMSPVAEDPQAGRQAIPGGLYRESRSKRMWKARRRFLWPSITVIAKKVAPTFKISNGGETLRALESERRTGPWFNHTAMMNCHSLALEDSGGRISTTPDPPTSYPEAQVARTSWRSSFDRL